MTRCFCSHLCCTVNLLGRILVYATPQQYLVHVTVTYSIDQRQYKILRCIVEKSTLQWHLPISSNAPLPIRRCDKYRFLLSWQASSCWDLPCHSPDVATGCISNRANQSPQFGAAECGETWLGADCTDSGKHSGPLWGMWFLNRVTSSIECSVPWLKYDSEETLHAQKAR